MKDFLVRDLAGNRIRPGKTVRNLLEPALPSYVKHIDREGSYFKMTGWDAAEETSPTAQKSFSANRLAPYSSGETGTFVMDLRSRVGGTAAISLEVAFYDAPGGNSADEIGTRVTKSVTPSLTDAIVSVPFTAPEGTAEAKGIIKAVASNPNDAAFIYAWTGEMQDASGNNKWSSNAVNGVNWSTYRSPGWDGHFQGTASRIDPDFVANYGYTAFSGEYNDDILGGLICDEPFKPSNFREILFSVESFRLSSSDADLSPAIAICNDNKTAGFELRHDDRDEHAKLLVFKADGTANQYDVFYQMQWGGEEVRSRNLTLLLYPNAVATNSGKQNIVIMTGDQVIYEADHPDLIIDQAVQARAYYNNDSTRFWDQRRLLIAGVKLESAHN